jgi:hypothetical protein
MYGLTFMEMLSVWAAVSGAACVAVLLLGCIIAGLTPKRPQFFPRSQPPLWVEVNYGVEVEYTLDEVLKMAMDDGGALLESDRNVGKVYQLPRDRRAA